MTIILNDAVDGEMGVDGAHLVLEALTIVQGQITFCFEGLATYLGHTGDHVDDEGLDCPQASNVLATALPYREADLVVLSLLKPDVHVDMTDVLRQSSTRTLDGNEAGLDVHGDTLGDVELFGLENVTHLE